MLLDDDPPRAFVPYPAVPVPGASGGALAGLSFAVKDLYDVAGYPTGGGNPLMLACSGIKSASAPAVERCLAAGARFVGKTHTDELAFSMNGKNAHFGTPVNGGAPERIPGGSSSGSASAVSNGLCDFALGSDTGGSVRAPASHCGLFGIRPTHGRISLERCLPLAPSLDTCGFFARDATTFARVADVMLGDDPAPLPEQPRLLKPLDAWALIESAVVSTLRPALARIESVLGIAHPAALSLDSFETMFWNFRYIQGREAWLADGAFIERHAPPLGPGVAERFAWSKEVSDEQFAAACEFRVAYRAHLGALLGADGVLVMPTMPDVAPLRAALEPELEDYRNNAIKLLCASGLSGFPQVSLPIARRLDAPLGISLLGPEGSDRSLIALAERVAGQAPD